ncbi:MAG: hypothetical protein IJA23_00685 [Clostridia bacterium]|nr:hypothetical protein [Clostridia bacterium]
MYFNNFEEYKDQFNIYNLITLIDKNYRLVFDRCNKIFCVINIAKNNQICLNFKDFNQNIIFLLQKSRIENSYKIFNELEIFNENLNKKLIKNQIQKTGDKLHELSKIYKRLNTISIKTNKLAGDNYA